MQYTSLAWIDADGVFSERELDQLPALLAADGGGWLWLDIPEPDEAAAALLRDTFGLHPTAVADAIERNHLPRLHAYSNALFLVVHRPEIGTSGHIHYLELDQFVGRNFLITIHGPRNPVVPLERMLAETEEVERRMKAGRFRPASPLVLSFAIVSTLTKGEERLLNGLARDVGRLEQEVMSKASDHRPTEFLEELFRCRHAIATVHTMSAQGREIYGRAVRLMAQAPKAQRKMLNDVRDQYDRIAHLSESQLGFLQGVTEFYRARTDTKMTIAAERLAVIAAVTLPVTAISSVMGMNVIVNDSTQVGALTVLLLIMAALSVWLLIWAKRQGWW